MDLASIHHPVLVMNGESDKMVPTKNTVDLDRRLPNSQLVVYPDAGHGGVFQFHEDFVKRALEFLATVWPHGSSRASCSRVNPRSRSPTVARLQSEEGLIIGISFAPALHD